MLKLAELKITKIFSAYSHSVGNSTTQYMCDRCSQQFAARWTLRANYFNPYSCRGNHVTCPWCGAHHSKHMDSFATDEYVPYRMTLTVSQFKHQVRLTVNYEATAFTGLFKQKWIEGKEIFKFDVRNRQTTFSKQILKTDLNNQNEKGVGRKLCLGSPFDTEILRESVLRFLRNGSEAKHHYSKELHHLIRTLREAVKKIIEKRDGRAMKETMYINAQAADSGMVLLPVMNLACRVLIPDLSKDTFPFAYWTTTKSLKYNQGKGTDGYGSEWLAGITADLRRGKDYLSAVVASTGLPDTAAIRQIIAQDIFSLGRLKDAFSLVTNYDKAVRLYRALADEETNPRLKSFLEDMLPIYGESGILRMAERKEKIFLHDCVRMYHDLTPENLTRFRTERIRIKDLHDWLAIVHRRQGIANFQLDVPEHIVKRLSMQTDKVKFFLPEVSHDLLDAGHYLRNCVASYCHAVKNGDKLVVLVADEGGKLVACLEIEEKTIVQAKVNRNKPVATVAEINRAVVEWAKATNLAIDTKDIDLLADAATNEEKVS